MVITRLSGGMGNQMFQYALGRVLSIRNNTNLGLDMHDLLDRTPRPKRITPREYDLDVFNIHAEIVSQSQIPFLHRSYGSGRIATYLRMIQRKLFSRKGREHIFNFDPRVLTLGPNTYLDGYWQSYKYFADSADTICADFTLRRPLSEQAQLLQSEIRDQNAVAMHVRRGDYVGNAFHEVITKDYYDRALAILQEKITIEHLYIFSDDIDWCRANFSFAYPTTFVGTEYAGEKGEGHMMLMSACKYFIIANSSFSWWAAWLAENPNKIVIAPKQWFSDAQISSDDLIPSDWIRI